MGRLQGAPVLQFWGFFSGSSYWLSCPPGAGVSGQPLMLVSSLLRCVLELGMEDSAGWLLGYEVGNGATGRTLCLGQASCIHSHLVHLPTVGWSPTDSFSNISLSGFMLPNKVSGFSGCQSQQFQVTCLTALLWGQRTRSRAGGALEVLVPT